ncbi:2-C-methyl-D-erythritol 4-phosphate cytidylyltransferase [Bowmanella dokdonensis]|uniref:2-C-methyl-D-erythritol 4-phosphate cytidylyltransferase n=1 Tax=Bowmanella dokdonensis TaxID=751969 RepID=A0A939DPF9_9ALTE|nr:2-C-methyl-D-erythritol 4-phosphate cytidylyltransferase [Bowmanella dokdonensis]MBN7826549.1 2-C-methyl-D-erythritol 4-phosphate cytidylyltransferase [Bowmanella dokdonensis]
MPPSTKQYSVVVPAAGVGARMQNRVPKQYLKIAGKTLLEHCLENLIRHPAIKQVILALHPQDPYFEQLPLAGEPWLQRVEGGAERADSVLAGLEALDNDDWVLVHDAARPCLPHQDLDTLLALARGATGGILAIPVRDTMKRGDGHNLVLRTESREGLWHALTPQFFPLPQLKDALRRALQASVRITDEASAIEWAGGKVNLVPGSPCNIKVTQPDDLILAEFYLTRMHDA